jgi:hypothetical protein
MKKTSYDMLYLATCAVNGVVPDKDKITQIDLQKLFDMCQFHCLTATVDVALESAGVKNSKFVEAESKAIKKNLLLDMEREKLFQFMEQNGIWHMPLKGVILKDMYPKTGMRQMSDNDILYDAKFQNEVCKYMKSHGYSAESVGKGNHDVYMKPPIFNYELHSKLFNEDKNKNLFEYYKNIENRLVKDTDKNYAYHFTDEDFYIYITAHEYKHFIGSGTGLRSLMDCYIYIKSKGDSMDWDYISKELKTLNIADFEENRRNLAIKVFSNPNLPELSSKETELLEYYLFSGTYGTMKNSVKNGLEKENNSKFKYILHRFFPPMSFYKIHHPIVYKYKFLVPFFSVYRIVRGAVLNHKKISAEFNILRGSKS